MSDHKKQELRRLFGMALELPASERKAFLERECAGDAELKQRVQRLLDAAEDERVPGSRTETPQIVVGNGAPTALREGPGTVIGPYTLVQQIGEGGFGVVFMAEQTVPVRRKVALKIIKLGMDTRQIVARFEAERQALALMEHPNIARVIDGGATETGRPYFVMELVLGEPIAAYCDTNKLSIEERLDLFAQVCVAVQHAHSKGLIHRDIKPSNILVGTQDGRPVAKVIDFGIAKATSARLTDRTVFTEEKQVIGTLQYMSPEQAQGSLDIDTRSDVYSLGVVLYELLTGSTPFDVKTMRDRMYSEVQRMIVEDEPPKPSTRLRESADTLASIAAQRRVAPKRLGMLVHGELDWIVMKALEKDRTRRYETANGLALDVRRYLAGEAVVAAPPSRAYRLSKFVRRNKGTVTAAAIVALALILGMAGTLWQAKRANDQRDLAVLAKDGETKQLRVAEAERDKANKIADFMADTLKGAGPSKARGRDITMVREIMDDAAERIESGELKDAPEAELRLRGTIGTTYRELSLYPEARKMIEPALALARDLYPGDSDALGRAITDRAVLLLAADKGDEGEPLAREALAMFERLHPGDHDMVSTAANNVGEAVRLRGDWKGAEQYFRRAFEMKRRLDPSDNWGTAKDLDNLAKVLVTLDKDDAEAETLMKQSLDMRRRLFKGDHPEIATGINNMGYVLDRRGDYEGAERMIREALEMIQRLHPGDHADVAVNLYNLARAVERKRDPKGAEKLYREALAMSRRLFSGDHPTTASALARLLFVLQSLGQWEESMQVGIEAVEMLRRLHPGGHVELVQAVGDLGVACWRNRRLDLSVPLFEESLRGKEATLGRKNSIVQNNVANLAINYKDAGRFADAIPLLEEAYQFSKEDPDLDWVVPALCEAYIGASRSLGSSMTAKAVALTREAVAAARAKHPAGSTELANELATNALTFLLCEEWTDAENALRECLTIREAKQPNAWRTFNTKSSLGGALLGQKKYTEAEPLLVAGYEGLKARESEVDKTRLQQALERLVRLCEATGDPKRAAEWKEKLEAERKSLGEARAGADKR